MSTWIPIPTWDGLHPIIIHFPIALLLIAPLFVLIGIIQFQKYRTFCLSALILMVAGSIAAWIAVATGEAAGQMVIERTPEINNAILEHADFGENTRLLFTVLTVIYALMLALPLKFRAILPRTLIVLHLLFLLLYGASCLVLMRTGHLGGRLVHALGVHAMMEK